MYKDQLDLSAAVIHASTDVRSWAIGPALTGVEFKDGTADQGNTCGIRPVFDRERHGWRNFTPPGWEGPLQFTLWIFVRVDGVWHGAGLAEFWKDREWSGDLIGNWHNWVYNTGWGPEIERNAPDVGEQIGVMVAAGDQRKPHDIRTVHERSQVALVTVAAHGYVAIHPEPDVQVDPVVDPQGDSPPAPEPMPDGLVQRVAALEAAIRQLGNLSTVVHVGAKVTAQAKIPYLGNVTGTGTVVDGGVQD